MGVSLVLHPRNPYVPTVHMNVRCFAAEKSGADPVWWFGGGMDLTPYYGATEDAVHFHRTCRDALAPFGAERYPKYKRWCDEYFHLRHRNEPRGVGGIFYDDVSTPGFATCFALTRSVGEHFLPAYVPIVERRRAQAYGERERAVPGVSPRALRRIQSGLRPRHALRVAIGRACGIDPHVDAADGHLALRLEAGARDTGSEPVLRVPGREGLAYLKLQRVDRTLQQHYDDSALQLRPPRVFNLPGAVNDERRAADQ